MPILDRATAIETINRLTEGRTSDTDLTDIENLIDTVSVDNAAEVERLRAENTAIEQKWREKYRAAFFNGADNTEKPDNVKDYTGETINDLLRGE